MPQLSLMNKILPQPEDGGDGGGEKASAAEDISKNYHALCSAVAHSETDENAFSAGNDKKKLFSKHMNYFGRMPINFTWKDITLKTKEGATILSGLSGSTCSGELTAIMGPSGAGKTSLLNVLSGFTQLRVKGRILLNGYERDMKKFKQLSCYILQDDHILPRFTVRELITIASRLKIPSTISEKERQKTVDDCIYSLGLVGQQNQRANTLSGGQRKRLCIAQEIVNNPPLIFLDEPTSGLDSASCLQCMQLLKSLAEEGRNVICTIHQPSSRIYEIFDNLYMIADGQCIYRGTTKNLLPFLSNQGLKCPKYHSPTDFITDVAIGLYGIDWNWKLKNAIDSTNELKNSGYQIDDGNMPEEEESDCTTALSSLFECKAKVSTKENWLDESHKAYPTSFLNQFRVLWKRSYLTVVREPMNLKLKFFGCISIGLLLGSLYYDTGNDGALIFNTAGFLFTYLVFLVVGSKVPTILIFPAQRTVFEREHMNGWYSLQSYYLARTTAELPFQILYPAISSGLVYWLTGQPPEMTRFCLFLLSAILISLIAESIGLMIGAGTSVQNGIYLAGVVISPSVILSGSILSLSDTPAFLRWLCYCTYTRYGLQSIFLNLYKNREPLSCKKFCFFTDPMKLVRHKDMDGDLYVDYWAMLAFLIVFRIASYLVLHFNVSRRR